MMRAERSVRHPTLPAKSRLPAAWLALVLIVAMAIAVAMLGNNIVGTWTDDAYYVNLAESIVRGVPMHRVDLPRQPIEWLVPPGYPLLLAPFYVLGNGEFWPMQLLSLLLHVAVVPLIYRLARVWLPTSWSLVATTLYALHFLALHFATQILTEAVFVFVTVVALLVYDAVPSQPDRRLRAVLRWTVPVAGALLRAVGLPMLLAVSVHGIITRRWRVALVYGVLFVVAIWLYLWVAPALSTPGTVTYRGVAASSSSPAEGTLALVLRGQLYAWSYTPEIMLPGLGGATTRRLLDGLGVFQLVAVLRVGVLILLMLGFLLTAKAAIGLSHLWSLLYLGFLIVYPVADDRYLLPLLPLLYIWMCVGIMRCWSLLPRGRDGALGRRLVPTLTLTALLLLFAYQWWLAIKRPVTARIVDPRPGLEWVRHNTPADAVVLFNEARMGYLYSRRPVVEVPDAGALSLGDPLAFLCERGVDVVVAAPRLEFDVPPHLPAWMEYQLLPRFSGRSGIDMLYATPDGSIRVFGVSQAVCREPTADHRS
jgi:hypothetical protein